MKKTILVVEDNPAVLFNLKITLEFDNYDVLTAENGKEGIKVLSEMDTIPTLIISDIMMPEMNGYEFFKTVSLNPDWSFIPFLFLTAKATPEDVRFGKLLGVDDYITKPFIAEDLLAVIKGKIIRYGERNLIRKQIEEQILSSFHENSHHPLSVDAKSSISLLFFAWDEELGPELINSYPKDPPQRSELMYEVGIQLFQASVSIFGQHGYYGSAGVLLNVQNINQDSYVFFDTKKDEQIRGGEKLFMLAVLAPNINYFKSLRINDLFLKISSKIKQSAEWNIKKRWEEVSQILNSL